MAIHNVPANAGKVVLDLVVTRADTGEQELRPLAAYYNRNPLFHYPVNWWIKVRDYFREG